MWRTLKLVWLVGSSFCLGRATAVRKDGECRTLCAVAIALALAAFLASLVSGCTVHWASNELSVTPLGKWVWDYGGKPTVTNALPPQAE